MLLPPRMGPWLELCEIRHSREISSVIVIVIVCEKRPWILINNTQNKLYRTCKVVPEWSIVTRKAGNWRGARSRLTVRATLGTEALPYTTPPTDVLHLLVHHGVRIFNHAILAKSATFLCCFVGGTSSERYLRAQNQMIGSHS